MERKMKEPRLLLAREDLAPMCSALEQGIPDRATG
jgi:hypothetical protein